MCGPSQLYCADPTKKACVVWSDDGLEKGLPTHLIFDVDNPKSSFQDLKANAYPSNETKHMGKANFCLCAFWIVEVIHRYRTKNYINEMPRGKFKHGSLGEDLIKVRENHRKGVTKNVQ